MHKLDLFFCTYFIKQFHLCQGQKWNYLKLFLFNLFEFKVYFYHNLKSVWNYCVQIPLTSIKKNLSHFLRKIDEDKNLSPCGRHSAELCYTFTPEGLWLCWTVYCSWCCLSTGANTICNNPLKSRLKECSESPFDASWTVADMSHFIVLVFFFQETQKT